MDHAKAYAIAQSLMDTLAPACERIEIAGSLRRMKTTVKDIELVAIPAVISQPDLFGNPIQTTNRLIELLEKLEKSGRLRFDKGQFKYRQYFVIHEGIALDLFMVTPPADWGVIFTQRTGPREFSRLMVSQRRIGGFLPSHAVIKDGGVWEGDIKKPMPEEINFFDYCGLPYIDPPDREAAAETPKELYGRYLGLK